MKARTFRRNAWIVGLVLVTPLVLLGGLIAVLATATTMLGRQVARRRLEFVVPATGMPRPRQVHALPDEPSRLA